MQNFQIRVSFYLLPIFFFVLSISPNISGDRIGLVLVSAYFLLIPTANYFGWRLGKIVSTTSKPSYAIDIMALIVLIGAFYIGMGISWQYLLMQILFTILTIIKERKEDSDKTGFIWYLIMLIYALLFYALIYIGLNQYSFQILFNLSNMLQALLTATVVITIFYLTQVSDLAKSGEGIRKKLTLIIGYIILQIIVFGGFFQITTEIKYAIYFAITLMLPILILVWIKRQEVRGNAKDVSRHIKTTVRLVVSFQALFFLYYFLDTTQVLQAIQGGY